MLGNEIVSALIDTGSTVSQIREDVSTKIVDHSRLSKINTVLYGLGQTEVITKGSFEYDFVLDKDQYSLTWHVVPTKQLNFEAIIGTDILGQASLNFTQEVVMFHKHEEKPCLIQISGVHPEDELDFSHILDSQVKNDLTRITSSYKPEKTESTDVTRRIILNDDIPVYQPARRLSYVEKKSVNKHIEEWLEQGIVRPSSSKYASHIVLVKNKKTYNKKRKKAPGYQVGDLVAVQRTQFGGGLKLRPKFFGPYQITDTAQSTFVTPRCLDSSHINSRDCRSLWRTEQSSVMAKFRNWIEKSSNCELKEIRKTNEYLNCKKLQFTIDTSTTADSNMPKLELHKLLPIFDPKTTDVTIFLDLFERQLTFLKVPVPQWVVYLVGLLPTEVSNLIAKESVVDAQDYYKVKQILLKRFKLSAEKFRQMFSRHVKDPVKTWRDFYFDLQTYFDGWLRESKVTTLEELKDLIVADQIKKKTPQDYKDHFLDQWCNWNNPLQLVDKLDSYEEVKNMRNKNNKNFSWKQRNEFQSLWRSNYTQNPKLLPHEHSLSGFLSQSRRKTGVPSNSRRNPTSNDRIPEKKIVDTKEDRTPVSCYGYGALGIIRSRCHTCNPVRQKIPCHQV
ncbi:tigger transposable element-derived protein 6 [Trichonephila clavipes]|nr:tigger transposable element-derived protein 6 [Trichonephila clavipes]